MEIKWLHVNVEAMISSQLSNMVLKERLKVCYFKSDYTSMLQKKQLQVCYRKSDYKYITKNDHNTVCIGEITIMLQKERLQLSMLQKERLQVC